MNIYSAGGVEGLQSAEFHATTATGMQIFQGMWMHKHRPTKLFLISFGECGETETALK